MRLEPVRNVTIAVAFCTSTYYTYDSLDELACRWIRWWWEKIAWPNVVSTWTRLINKSILFIRVIYEDRRRVSMYASTRGAKGKFTWFD